jgi:site-specific recombinase XerD
MSLYARTSDVLLVQAALGHRAISSTLVYARASAERVRAAVVG